MSTDPMTLWTHSLIAGGAVIVVVALLLVLILVTARKIDRTAAAIWDVGQNIARNTVSIWMLQQTNAAAGEILSTAKSIVAAASSIEVPGPTVTSGEDIILETGTSLGGTRLASIRWTRSLSVMISIGTSSCVTTRHPLLADFIRRAASSIVAVGESVERPPRHEV